MLPTECLTALRRVYKLSSMASKLSKIWWTALIILFCSACGGIGISTFEYSEIQYRLCVFPISLIVLIKKATYSISKVSWICSIFIADDLTLKGKSINREAVVKSSKIIQGNLLYTPSVSLVYPIVKDLPAVSTGVG